MKFNFVVQFQCSLLTYPKIHAESSNLVQCCTMNHCRSVYFEVGLFLWRILDSLGLFSKVGQFSRNYGVHLFLFPVFNLQLSFFYLPNNVPFHSFHNNYIANCAAENTTYFQNLYLNNSNLCLFQQESLQLLFHSCSFCSSQ